MNLVIIIHLVNCIIMASVFGYFYNTNPDAINLLKHFWLWIVYGIVYGWYMIWAVQFGLIVLDKFCVTKSKNRIEN